MTQNSIKNKFSNSPNPPLPSGPEALLGRQLKGGEGGFFPPKAGFEGDETVMKDCK